MINIPSSPGVKLALLEAQLLSGEIDRSAFLERASQLGLAGPDAGSVADKVLAIAANQAARRENLKASYDYIVIGSGAAGSVVARRLAENRKTQVLLLEAGGEDLKPNVLVTENWYSNQGGPMDWNFMAEPSAAVNNRSIHQAMGKAFGGGTSINGMVWARSHKNDFNYWAKESGDECWGYAHILEIYKRIEDWHGAPDPTRRGTGGIVFVQAAPDPNPMAPAFLKATERIGIPTFADQNGILQEGPGGGAVTNVRIRDGRRLNIPEAYLYPIMDQPNLTAAGAIQTPKILMLSGIGDRAELTRFGIACVSNLSGVGRDFQDHPVIGASLWEPHELPARANADEANAFKR